MVIHDHHAVKPPSAARIIRASYVRHPANEGEDAICKLFVNFRDAVFV